MPKLRPPLSKKEDIEKVPLNEPVEIELSEDNVIETASPNSADQNTALEQQQQPVVADESQEDEEKRSLKEQLAALRESEAKAREQAEKASRQLQEREATYVRETTELATRADTAQYDAILNAIGAATADAESAAREYAQAMAANDLQTATDAQRKISRAEARLVSLEDGKIAYEQRFAEAKRKRETQPLPQQQTQPQQQSDIIENHINQIGINDVEKNWLREHRDFLADQRKNIRLQNAHLDADDAGYRRGTQPYLDFIEEKLGLVQTREQPIQQQQRSPIVSAPPSRMAPVSNQQQTNPTKITLTPEQREAARLAGVDEITYAQNLIKMNKLKAEGYYQER